MSVCVQAVKNLKQEALRNHGVQSFSYKFYVFILAQGNARRYAQDYFAGLSDGLDKQSIANKYGWIIE